MVQNADGLLLAERKVKAGEIARYITVGVVVQSEFTTSSPKANPLGKAALMAVPLGISARIDKKSEMRRIDGFEILFVLPKSASFYNRRRFNTNLRNIELAAWISPVCRIMVVDKGISKKNLVIELKKAVSKFLRGVGRPPRD